MNFYVKEKHHTFDCWLNIISIFGAFFLFSNCVLYIFSAKPIHMILGFVSIILMMLRLVKWYDD